jgi:CRP-like cAMP-binding protein
MEALAVMNELEASMRETSIVPGRYLYFEGQTAAKVYLVRGGTVKLSKTTHDGKEFILGMASIGEVLGYPESIYGGRYTSSAYVVSKSDILELSVPEFDILLQTNARIAYQMVRQLSLHQMKLLSKIRDLVLFDKEVALCSTMIRLANTFGEPCDSGIKIGTKFTHREIAEMSGTTRERVNRLLAELKEQGIVTQQDGYIIIHEMNSLREICGCEDCPLEVCRI